MTEEEKDKLIAWVIEPIINVDPAMERVDETTWRAKDEFTEFGVQGFRQISVLAGRICLRTFVEAGKSTRQIDINTDHELVLTEEELHPSFLRALREHQGAISFHSFAANEGSPVDLDAMN